MKKSLLYGAIVTMFVQAIILPTVARAVGNEPVVNTSVSKVKLSALKVAIAAQKPNLTLIQELAVSLLNQDIKNLAKIQNLAKNAPQDVQDAINAAIEATGAITDTTTINTPKIPVPPPVLPTDRNTSTTDTGGTGTGGTGTGGTGTGGTGTGGTGTGGTGTGGGSVSPN